jgi:glycine C-acetyltransferase
VFEPLLGEEDAIVSDELNHCVDHRRRAAVQGRSAGVYKTNDMADLERCLKEAREKGCRQI